MFVCALFDEIYSKIITSKGIEADPVAQDTASPPDVRHLMSNGEIGPNRSWR